MIVYCVCGEGVDLKYMNDTSSNRRKQLLKRRYQFIKKHRPCREREDAEIVWKPRRMLQLIKRLGAIDTLPQLEKDDG